MKTSKLFSTSFWAAINSLMEIESIPAAGKLELVKLKRSLVVLYEDAKEAGKGMDNDALAELMGVELQLCKISDTIPMSELVEHLSASQLYELSDLMEV